MDIVRGNMGWIELICGPMFSGKSEELIRRLRRAEIAQQRVQIFKPAIDNRYAEREIVSHSELRIPADLISGGAEILERTDARTEVIGVDEAHFLDNGLVSAAQQLANMGKRVIIAGVDVDFLGQPFEQVQQLMTAAEEVTKLLAICARCGNPAKHSQRLVSSGERILVGASDKYEARCRRCFEPTPVKEPAGPKQEKTQA